MHINSLVVSRRHRHVLALPMLVLALAAGSLSGVPSRAQTTPDTVPIGSLVAKGEDRMFVLPGRAAGLVREDGILYDDGPELILEEGTVIIDGPGMLHLRIADVLLTSLHGGFLAARSGQKFSVHALTSPVLLTRGAFQLVIPVGMQGSWASSEMIPIDLRLPELVVQQLQLQAIRSDLLRDELRALSALPPVTLPAREKETNPQSLLMPLMLTDAKERTAATSARMRLLELRTALDSGDVEAAHALLSDPETRTVFSSTTQDPSVLPLLLAESAGLPSVSEKLMHYVSDSRLWLLLSFHPAYRLAAWETAGGPSIASEARVTRWLQLPSSDLGDAVPAHAVERWQEQATKHLAQAERPLDFIEALLRSMSAYRGLAEQSGYPERLHRYSRALQALVQPYEDSLSPTIASMLAPWKTVDAIEAYVEPPAPLPAQTSAPIPAPVSAEAFDAAALEAQARQMLLDAGFLLTTTTVVEAKSATQVSVRDILFASSKSEHLFHFLLRIPSGKAERIERDGKALPYAMKLDALANSMN